MLSRTVEPMVIIGHGEIVNRDNFQVRDLIYGPLSDQDSSSRFFKAEIYQIGAGSFSLTCHLGTR